MIIDKRRIHYNFSPRYGTKIAYIVIHDTANKAPGANALNHYRYFAGGNRKASAHYFVDDKGIVQIIEDNMSAWHCGDGKGRYGITNSNSLGIEMCINEGSDFKKVMERTADLAVCLAKFYNLKPDKIVRHYDASRKICPSSLCKNNWQGWWIFKEVIKSKYEKIKM